MPNQPGKPILAHFSVKQRREWLDMLRYSMFPVANYGTVISHRVSMSPKFTDSQTWQQADLLMQPVMIRLVDNLRKQLEQTSWHATYEQTESPIPGYHIHLTLNDQERIVDIWELCYAICFQSYQLDRTEPQPVTIDPALLDTDGDVDWHYLDDKAQQVVAQMFSTLN